MNDVKHEMIFGDESLFDGAPEDAEAVGGGRPYHEVVVFYKFSDGEFQYKYKEEAADWKPSTCKHPQTIIKAMRRIIRTPIWTVEDQKAGKLPDVGCRVNFCYKLNTNWRTGEIKYIDDQVAVIKADAIDRPFVYEVDRVGFNPIESQEEKAQREEDEFVKSEMKDTTLSIEWACIYERGVRAAYRKLSGELAATKKKGGE